MKRKNGRTHGEVFTKKRIVQFILDEVGYQSGKDLRNVRILEPASGHGAFAIEIIDRLAKSSSHYGFDFINTLNNSVQFVEIDPSSFEILKRNILSRIQYLGFPIEKICNSIFSKANYLQIQTLGRYDCIVGNPPYIRHEIIDSSLKLFYKKTYSTFKFRADLYVLFYEKSLQILAEKGRLSFICSNRWLFNQYGKPLREMIATSFHLEKVINIEQANVFDEVVIAYPCITTIKKDRGNFTAYFESNKKEIDVDKIDFIKVPTPKDCSWQNLFLDYDINHQNLLGIEEQGFKIGIGVATGADKIFIKRRSELNGIERSRLMPIIQSKSLKGNKIDWDGSFVLNPFENESICNLDNFPHFKAYLSTYKDVLRKRHIAKNNPKNWYKTIDKIKPDLQRKYKLLLPDLSGSKFLFIDEGKFYPHHNVYYITHPNLNDLKLIACILMSDFIKDQLSKIGLRMNGGLPRFQSQTLKKLRIPQLDHLPNSDKNILIDSYNGRNFEGLNKVVNKYCSQHRIKT